MEQWKLNIVKPAKNSTANMENLTPDALNVKTVGTNTEEEMENVMNHQKLAVIKIVLLLTDG